MYRYALIDLILGQQSRRLAISLTTHELVAALEHGLGTAEVLQRIHQLYSLNATADNDEPKSVFGQIPNRFGVAALTQKMLATAWKQSLVGFRRTAAGGKNKKILRLAFTRVVNDVSLRVINRVDTNAEMKHDVAIMQIFGGRFDEIIPRICTANIMR